ncbi:MAG: hypothetical protein K9W43_06845 [Candidatus Thorarchaeota archaeon]|nr:hypothetical protein [Candidatus Thorarchaeota archaeon]
MVTGYEVSDDGTLQEIDISKDTLDSTRVFCVVDDSTRSIYLWKGNQAGIRKKFIGARVATNLRTEYGFHFKVRPVDEGEEPPTFFTALDGTTTATRVIKPGVSAPSKSVPPPTPPKKPKAVSASTSTASPAASTTAPPPTPPKKTTTAPPPTPPKKTTTVPPTKPPKTTARSASAASASVAASSGVGAVSDAEIQAMIHELEETAPPEGYRRELLIVYNRLYTVTERRTSIFGQEKIERKFELVKDPPEGTFMAEGFIPRVIVKDGMILGIELLKGTPDAILSPIKTEMKERLSDLISFFKSEVEAEEAPVKPKTKRKRKLVAK